MTWQEWKESIKRHAWVIFLVAGHCTCGALMALANKWALNHFPHVFALTFAQLCFAALAVMMLKVAGVAKVDNIEWAKLKAYLPASGMFFITLVSANKVIHLAGVDTFIILRSCIPFICAFMEMGAFNQPWPELKAMSCLGLMIVGAVIYACADGKAAFNIGLDWVLIFLLSGPIDSVLVKKVVSDVELTPWGRALYNNLGAAMFAPLAAVMADSPADFFVPSVYQGMWAPGCVLPVCASMCMGFLISYFMMNVRAHITATAFLVLGVVNKFGTVFFNHILFAHHASAFGALGVVTTISSGVLWQCAMSGRSLTPQKPQEQELEESDEESAPFIPDARIVADRKVHASPPPSLMQLAFAHPFRLIGIFLFVISVRNWQGELNLASQRALAFVHM